MAVIPANATWVRFPRFVGDDGAPSTIARRSRSGSGSSVRGTLRSGRGFGRRAPRVMRGGCA